MTRTYYEKIDETVYRHTLDNGLEIMVLRKPGFLKKTAHLVVNYGSFHTCFVQDGERVETPTGVAHYLEHKMFDMPGERDINEEFAALGVDVNAFTTYDMTAYHISATDCFWEGLRLLIEFVTTPWFAPELVEKERGIITQEILMYADNPSARLFEQLCEDLCHYHPARHPVAGTVESIQEITPELLERCYRAFYHPANMMLCVAGDVDPEEVAALAEAMFPRERQSKAVPDFGPEEPLEAKNSLTNLEMDVAHRIFSIGFKFPATAGGEEMAYSGMVTELACAALAGESSELYQRLYDEGVINDSFDWSMELVDRLSMVNFVGVSQEPERVREEIVREAARLAETGIPEEEFRRLLRGYLGDHVKALDGFNGSSVDLCVGCASGYDPFRFPERLATLRPEALQNFWRENLRKEWSSLVIMDPCNRKEN